MATVGGEEPFAGGVEGDFSGVIAARETTGERRDFLAVAVDAFLGRTENRDRRIEFAQDIDRTEIALVIAGEIGERDVTGPRPRSKFELILSNRSLRRYRSVAQGERSLGRIKAVHEDAVESEVGNVDSAAERHDPVGVRSFLAFFIGPEGAGVFRIFHAGGGGAEFAVGKDWEDDYVAGGVVGDEKKFAGFVEGKVAGVFAEGGELVEEGELGGFAVDRKGGDGALPAGFIGGIEEFAVGMNGNPGGIRRFGGQALGGKFSGGGVKFERVDALAVRFIGVGPREDEEFLIARRRVAERNGREQPAEDERK